MKERIDAYFEEHQEEMIEDIKKLIAIRSVKGEAEEGKPFGAGPAAAVACVEELAAQMGLSTVNFDNYMLEVNLNEHPTELGILAHLDVVPEGKGWSSPPYEAEVREGKIYGRGAADNKGPAVSALYALRAVKELGAPLTKNCRLMLGTDEESGMSDLTYYFTKQTPPPHSFSPDAAFPVYNLEKGGLRTSFTAAYETDENLPKVAWLKGGHTVNIVAEEGEALILGLSLDELEKICRETSEETKVELECETKSDGILVSAKGASTHASYPEYGNNAVTALLVLVNKLPLAESEGKSKLSALAMIFPHNDYYGKAAGIANEDELSGPLTISFDILNYTETELTGWFDIRSPICSNEENTSQVLAARLAESGMQLATTDMIKPHYVPEDIPFIQHLLKRYEEFTGLNGECVAMGGGTYVHGIPGSVAFGPSYPETETYAHGPDECIVVAELMAGAKMFTQIIIDMCS